jgi:hypothetical protein
MLTKTNSPFLPILLLTGVLIVLSSCGSRSGSASGPDSTPSGKPDSVKIEISGAVMAIDGVVPSPVKPVVTLTANDTLQQLYSVTYALPQRPEGQICPADAGPGYTLTFLLRNKTLGTAVAEKAGCDSVTITGEQHDREATKEFWTLLDRAIYQATPPAHPTQLSIMHVPPANQVAQTTLITNINKVQRLYSAILALPLAGYANDEPTYQLVFHENNLIIPATIYPKSNLINLEGNFRTRGGWYTMNDRFKQLLAETLSGTTPEPAHPDQILLNLSPGNKPNRNITITNTTLIQQLYTKALALPLAQPQQFPACVGDDKVHGKGTWYSFTFSQWNLPVLQLGAYEGCAAFATNAAQQYLQSDQEFWSLVHRAVS